MKQLLLDVGSSFVKYSFYDNVTGENTDIRAVTFPGPTVDDGVRYEVSREELDKLFMQIICEAEAEGCEAVFICVQMHGYIIKKGDSFSDYMSWKDKRGGAYLTDENRELFEYGTRLKANLARLSLRSFSSLEGSEFFTLGSYISYLFTGNNITHITDACASGFFNASTCEQSVIFEGMTLPTAVNTMKPCGKYHDILIYPSTGDHPVSFLGAGVLSSELLLNLGTAAQLTALVKEDCERIEGLEYRPYFEKNTRIATLSGINSSDYDKIIDAIKRYKGSFGGVETIRVSGGASEKYSSLTNELNSIGYKVEFCRHNVGNEGLKRLADSVYPVRGTMLSEVEFINFPLVMKKAGLDFFIIDNEHGSFENRAISTIAMNAKNAGIKAIVRLPNNERAMITKLADGGVSGFLLPMTNKKEDIEKVVGYAKYVPAGKRGISTTRVHTSYGVSDLKEYMSYANQQMKIYAQIETREGVANIKDIVEVPEVEGIFIGPNDLSCDYDCMGDTEKIKELISEITRACVEGGKRCGIITTNKDMIRHALLCGCTMVSYGSEINMLLDGGRRAAKEEYLS